MSVEDELTLPRLVGTWRTLRALMDTYPPASPEREHLLEARLLVTGEGLGRFGSPAWQDAISEHHT